MNAPTLSKPDKNGIIKALPPVLSNENKQRLKTFGSFVFFYDFIQQKLVLPRFHKADSQRHTEILKTLISPIKTSRILDIACGTGRAITYFDKSNDYTGFDLSYPMLKQAVKKAKKKSFTTYRFIQGNAEELLFADESFDIVFMDTALHMIPKYQLAIAGIAKTLKKDGRFVCSAPIVGINEKFDSNWKKMTDNYSLHSFTVDDLQSACSRNGLSFTHCGTNGGMLYFQAHKVK